MCRGVGGGGGDARSGAINVPRHKWGWNAHLGTLPGSPPRWGAWAGGVGGGVDVGRKEG